LVVRALKHLIITRDKRLGFLMLAGAATQMAALVRNCWMAMDPGQTPAEKE